MFTASVVVDAFIKIFTSSLIISEHEPSPTLAFVGSGQIDTKLVTISIVDCALVHILAKFPIVEKLVAVTTTAQMAAVRLVVALVLTSAVSDRAAGKGHVAGGSVRRQREPRPTGASEPARGVLAVVLAVVPCRAFVLVNTRLLIIRQLISREALASRAAMIVDTVMLAGVLDGTRVDGQTVSLILIQPVSGPTPTAVEVSVVPLLTIVLTSAVLD